MVANEVRIVGVHPIVAAEVVHLIEVEVAASGDGFDFSAITQEIPGQLRSDWQSAYSERQVGPGRVVFFFHYLDPARPLLSPAGPLVLPPETPVPENLQGIGYEQP